jgi:YVTN family beta-propeller protein
LALNSAETLLVSTNGNSNDVSFIDIRTLKVLKSSQVGRQPWGVAIKAD